MHLHDNFEEDLIKSIDALLEESDPLSIEHVRGVDDAHRAQQVWPGVRRSYIKGNAVVVGGQVYEKWSTVDSDELREDPVPPARPPAIHQRKVAPEAAPVHPLPSVPADQTLFFKYALMRNAQLWNLAIRNSIIATQINIYQQNVMDRNAQLYSLMRALNLIPKKQWGSLMIFWFFFIEILFFIIKTLCERNRVWVRYQIKMLKK